MSALSPSLAVRRILGIHEVLAERVARRPVLAEEDPPQVGMPVEDHAEHVVALALHPVRALPDVRDGGTVDDARAELRAQHEREPALEVLDAADHLEPLLLPVDGAEP